MTKYIIWTDHEAGFNKEDKVIELKAQKLFDAIKEATEIAINEENLFCVIMYERTEKNEYKHIMRSEEGRYWREDERNHFIERHVVKLANKKTDVWYRYY